VFKITFIVDNDAKKSYIRGNQGLQHYIGM